MALKRLGSLKDKLEKKSVVEKELFKLDDEIDEIVGETKSKIKKTSLKKAK